MKWRIPALAMCLVALPAWAQTEAPATRTDMTPAAPTQRSGPDAGQSYQYPPNTGNILTPATRTPYDPPPNAPGAGSADSAPGGNKTETSVAK